MTRLMLTRTNLVRAFWKNMNDEYDADNDII